MALRWQVQVVVMFALDLFHRPHVRDATQVPQRHGTAARARQKSTPLPLSHISRGACRAIADVASASVPAVPRGSCGYRSICSNSTSPHPLTDTNSPTSPPSGKTPAARVHWP